MSDLDKPTRPRLYGQADDSAQKGTSPADQGMRGEQGAPLGDPDPELAHEETVAGGRRVLMEETNGVGFAEATGRAGLEAQRAHDAKGSEK